MTDYFTAHDVLKSRGAEFLSTLNKWANFIQKSAITNFTMIIFVLPVTQELKERSITAKPECFHWKKSKISKSNKTDPYIGQKYFFTKTFDKKHHLDTMNHSELLTEIINQIEVKLANKEELFQALTKSTNNWKEAIKH